MNDPILEALNFVLETNLQVDNVRVPSTSTPTSVSQPLYSRRPIIPPSSSNSKNSKQILPSGVILGESSPTPCPIRGCSYTSCILSQPSEKQQYLAHLLTQHQLVIDDVDKIANLHKYIIHWKERFETAPLAEFCVGFVMDALPTPPPPRSRGRKVKVALSENNQKQEEEGDVDDKMMVQPEEGAGGATIVPQIAGSKDNTLELISEQKEKAFHEGMTLTDKPNSELYFMLTPALPEDNELRSKLWNARLETVLEVNRQEREQADFSRQCFFCREIFTGNRSSLFEHMMTDHSFRIGKPDNIVFVEEFLELISAKLNELICLHCEKVFKDKTILRDHMRKKGHKRLNSNNPEYNRYYIINYLEPGKDWKALEEEDQEDERTEEDWMEANEENANIVCLLCSVQCSSFDDILSHMKARHYLDFCKISENFDFYQKVKVVNFIRRTIFLNLCFYCEQKFFERSELLKHVSDHAQQCDEFPPEKVWNQPEYFFPTYENDQFLVLLDKDMDGEDDDDVRSTISSEEENLVVIPEDLPKLSTSLPLPQDLNMDVDFEL